MNDSIVSPVQNGQFMNQSIPPVNNSVDSQVHNERFNSKSNPQWLASQDPSP